MTLPIASKKKRSQTSRQRTIAPELLAQWQRLRRPGDSTAIAKKLQLSKGVIDNALIYGHVCQQSTIDGICEFYAERIRGEIDQAHALRDLVNGSQQPAA
jgi:hypothetical protein